MVVVNLRDLWFGGYAPGHLPKVLLIDACEVS
jgi:hypothetical protein